MELHTVHIYLSHHQVIKATKSSMFESPIAAVEMILVLFLIKLVLFRRPGKLPLTKHSLEDFPFIFH